MSGWARWIMAGVLGLVLLQATACGSTTGQSGGQVVGQPTATAVSTGAAGGASSPPAASSAPLATATARIGSRVVSGDLAITLHGVQDNAPEGATPIKAGARRYAVEITVENVARQATQYSALFGTVALSDDTAYTSVVSTEPAPPITGGSLEPGESVRGWVAYDIPSGTEPILFSYDDLTVHVVFALR